MNKLAEKESKIMKTFKQAQEVPNANQIILNEANEQVNEMLTGFLEDYGEYNRDDMAKLEEKIKLLRKKRKLTFIKPGDRAFRNYSTKQINSE